MFGTTVCTIKCVPVCYLEGHSIGMHSVCTVGCSVGSVCVLQH